MQVDDSPIPVATQIKRNEKSYKNLTLEANSILRHIGEEIETAIQNDKHKIIYTIPSILKVDGFSNSDSQTYITYHIMRALENKKYRISSRVNPTETRITIEWESEQLRLEIDTMREYIKLKSVV